MTAADLIKDQGPLVAAFFNEGIRRYQMLDVEEVGAITESEVHGFGKLLLT